MAAIHVTIMIVFDLTCEARHRFEVWFRSSADYENQKAQGFLECPHCGSHAIEKAIMAPNVGVKSNQKSEPARAPARGIAEHLTQAGAHVQESQAQTIAALPGGAPAASEAPASAPHSSARDGAGRAFMGRSNEALETFFEKVRQVVEKNFEDVGDNFAETARKIHYGEEDERGIYGTATARDMEELSEEGIDILPLPGRRRTDA